MGGVERDISRGGSTDRNGNSEVVRTFIVNSSTAEQIRAAPESITLDDGSTLPAYGSTFEGLRLDRIGTSPEAGGIVVVQAYYSKGGRFALPSPVPLTPEPGVNFRRSAAVSTLADPLPYAVKSHSTIYIDQQPIRLPHWRVLTQDVLSTVERYSASVPLVGGLVGDAMNKVWLQIGKIHSLPLVPDGVLARFDGADMLETEPDTYTITYTWTIDGGIRYNAELQDTDTIKFPRPDGDLFFTVPEIDGQWTRPPYYLIAGEANPNDDRDPPVWSVKRINVFQDNGWQGLAGLAP